ncbi:helix-turn-helix transcriptional regulator [Streptomyces sp. CT34]|uniref:helix-turn-helix domain-containing protein n=1 Tax=Streptomyces sp. CT34 TaxID=1553907 RepID=UPI0005BB130D|nr:helix-turn-helix transcriptional regulator [Streptomyces sp. CT34]
MKWNLRLTAAQRGVWKASELQRALAEHGLTISAGKMSALWVGQPVSVKLADLDVICVTLNCSVADLLLPEPETVTRPATQSAPAAASAVASPSGPAQIVPRRRDGRTLPPR